MLYQKLLSLSDLEMIGPVLIHPQSDIAERFVEQYCEELNIKPPHFQEYTTMSAYLFPSTNIKRLVAIDILTNLLYYIDDLFISHRTNPEDVDDVATLKIFQNCILIFRYGIMPKETLPVYATCKKLRDMMLSLSSEVWLHRLTTYLEDHFKSATLSIQAIMQDGILDINRYIKVREYDSAMHPTITLMEFAYGIFVPEEILAHPTMQILYECALRIGGLMNDLFSYHKEVILHGQRFNLVNVLMENRGCNFEEAVHKTVLMLNGYTYTFQNYERFVPVYANEEWNHMVQLYVRGLKEVIGATYHWQMSTNRYRSPQSPFPELQTMLLESPLQEKVITSDTLIAYDAALLNLVGSQMEVMT